MTRYQDMLRRLFEVRQAGISLDLGRVTRALDALGRPERGLGLCVHIGGTNGKGSCAAFVDSVARACGLRTGLFTSPHLTHFAERFQVQGQPADDHAVLDAYDRMCAVTSGLEPRDQPTFFEQITVMGVLLLSRAALDLTILEVGLGGRLDATNAIRSEVACVTGVALDHQDILGHDVRAIAREKAGIFKAGQRVVIGRSGEPEAVPVLIEAAERAGVAALTVVTEPAPEYLSLGLAGAHQRDNAAAALAVVEHLRALGALPGDVDVAERIAYGLAHVRHPGRIERVAGDPLVILDGAHNPHGAAALAREMAHWPRPRVLVLGMSGDKDAAAMLAELCPQADAVICSQADNPRSRPAADLFDIALAMRPALARSVAGPERLSVEPNVRQALARARELAGTDGTVVVAGSLFLVGEARLELAQVPAPFDIALSDPVGPPRARPRA